MFNEVIWDFFFMLYKLLFLGDISNEKLLQMVNQMSLKLIVYSSNIILSEFSLRSLR